MPLLLPGPKDTAVFQWTREKMTWLAFLWEVKDGAMGRREGAYIHARHLHEEMVAICEFVCAWQGERLPFLCSPVSMQ